MTTKHITPPTGFCSPTLLAGCEDEAPVAVALSGGADSVALLHILKQTHRGTLYAVHVHHGIRGAEADRDATFCEQLCARLDVPLTVIREDVPALAAKTGDGIETAARKARYAAFERFLSQNAIPVLATAHHADDQLETLLQHLLRGAGLRGMCGIPACRPLGAFAVVRPLLQVVKDDILQYCEHASLTFVTDSTNEEPCCARNRLRLEVLPVLRELWPSGAVCAARCAASLAEDEALLTSMANEFLQKEGTRPHCAALAALPSPLFARVMHALLPLPPQAVHVTALEELVQKARPHASLSVPGATVRVVNGCLLVESGTAPETEPYEITLCEGENCLPHGIAILTKGDNPPAPSFPYRHFATIRFNRAATTGELILRTRKEGDRILSGGRHKVVRKLACMSPFSVAERERLPLLCDGQGLVAVPTGPARDGVTRDPDTTLHLFFD